MVFYLRCSSVNQYSGGRKEGNVLFNDALSTFYLRLYGVGYMVKDHLDSDRGNPPLLFPTSSKGSFICTIPQTGYHWLERYSREDKWKYFHQLFFIHEKSTRIYIFFKTYDNDNNVTNTCTVMSSQCLITWLHTSNTEHKTVRHLIVCTSFILVSALYNFVR